MFEKAPPRAQLVYGGRRTRVFYRTRRPCRSRCLCKSPDALETNARHSRCPSLHPCPRLSDQRDRAFPAALPSPRDAVDADAAARKRNMLAHVGPVASVSVAVLAVSAVLAFSTTLLFTYTTCVLQSQCPPLPQLPTVSDTWTHPPGSFVSREAVSVMALFLGLLQYVLWLPEQQAFPFARVCMRVGMFSAFCLSWVGACVDMWSHRVPQPCRGGELPVLPCRAIECRSRAARTGWPDQAHACRTT